MSNESVRDYSDEIKFYRGLPVVENYDPNDINEIQEMIQKIEMESDLPNTLLEWKGKIFKSTQEVDEFLDGDGDECSAIDSHF